ncbi:MAG: glycosyltransferase [Bacteroidales bacterium]|nr:glycosyltransferase [Bacteroidales bacterium]
MISLIVCTYNRDAYVYKTLEHIAQNDFPYEQYEIILIDNNSTDNTAAECSRFHCNYPLVNYLYVKETQQGLSYARNRGYVESKGDCVVFLDDDAFVETNYLKNLSEYLQHYPEMQAFGGRIYPLYETGREPEWMSPRLVPLVSAIDKGDVVVPFEGKSYPIGANMGFRRECLDKVGLFNTALGRSKKNLMGGEEKDIFNRIKQASLSVLYLPNVQVHHVIPEFRTTIEFVKKMGEGIGQSEKIRCSDNRGGYLLALVKELWKWCGSMVLFVFYLLRGEAPKANAIVKFRWSVTKGLL